MLTNEHLKGKIPVCVINRKLDGTKFIETKEGYITKVLQGDRQGVLAIVRIGNEKVERWIFAHDQINDENFREVSNELN